MVRTVKVDSHTWDVGTPTFKEGMGEKETSKEMSKARQRHKRKTINSRQSFQDEGVINNITVQRRQIRLGTRERLSGVAAELSLAFSRTLQGSADRELRLQGLRGGWRGARGFSDTQ